MGSPDLASRGHGPLNSFIVRLTFRESGTPFLLDLSSLIYDLELLHDPGVILSYEQYRFVSFSKFFWYRNGRHLRVEHRLRVHQVELKSPLSIEIVVGGIAALWAFVQLVDKISNWSLNRQKLQLEVQRLQAETNIKLYEEETARLALESAIVERNATQIAHQIVRRLEANPIKLVELEVPRKE